MTNTRQRAIGLLRIIQTKTEHSGQPVFVSDLLDELGTNENEANAAFRYLTDHRLVDTFSIPYTGRINARGIDLLIENVETSHAAPVAQTREDSDHEWDAFISHASEDKQEFVRPLAERLRQLGLRIWYDEFSLTVGDSLRRSIDRGLAKSRFGIVIISPRFLEKSWPQKELDGLAAREVDGGKIILPVWHKIGADELRAYSPTLADRVAVATAKGLEHVAQELMKVVRQGDAPLAAQPMPQKLTAIGTDAERARLFVETTRWEPAGLRIQVSFQPWHVHIGMSARLVLLSPEDAVLREGRPTINPAPLASGGYTRYDVGGPFVEGIGFLRLRPAEVSGPLTLTAVFYLAPPVGSVQSLRLARVRVEIVTDAEEILVRQEMAVSPLV